MNVMYLSAIYLLNLCSNAMDREYSRTVSPKNKFFCCPSPHLKSSVFDWMLMGPVLVWDLIKGPLFLSQTFADKTNECGGLCLALLLQAFRHTFAVILRAKSVFVGIQ